MSFTINQTKYIQDTINLVFDFTSQLATGETLTAAVCTAVVFSGEDASPSSMIVGSSSFDGARVTQKITGGVAGVVYLVNCNATTNLSQEITMQTYIAVISSNPF